MGMAFLVKKHTTSKKAAFDPYAFFSTSGKGREMMSFQKRATVFCQGDSSDGLFFIKAGKVRLSVVSESGKEAPLPF
jgi:CRP-like cAMP-binding protein